MMDLDSAIQSFEDEMEKQTVLGHPENIDNLEQMSEWLKELKAYREQDGDAISRDKVIVQLSHLLSDWDDDWNVGIRKCIETVKSVESATPQPKNGRWVNGNSYGDQYNYYQSYVCSCCKHEYDVHGWNYCPNCGAKMQEVEE